MPRTNPLLLAGIFLPAVYLAARTMWGPIVQPPPPGVTTLRDFCPSSSFAYTRWPAVNDRLCLLTIFFRSVLLDPEGWTMLADMLAGFAGPVAVLTFEAERVGASWLVAFPLLLGLAYQNVGAGLTVPIYFLLLLITNGGASKGIIPRRRAEAVLFGLLVGYGVPTAAMLFMEDDRAALVWQLFPLLISFGRFAYASFRPTNGKEKEAEDGQTVVQLTYWLILSVSLVTHLSILFTLVQPGVPLWSLLQSILDKLFLPVPVPSALTHPLQYLPAHTSNFLKWDQIWIVGCSIIAGLLGVYETRMDDGVGHLTHPVTYIQLALGTLVLGPGAMVMVCWMWREAMLVELRRKEKTKTA